MPSLKITTGPLSGTTIPIGDDPFIFGRGQEDLGKLGDDRELSRSHAMVVVRDGSLMLEDLGSMNGTFVNGNQVDGSTVLREGDTIEIGSTKLEVTSVPAPVPATAPAEDRPAGRIPVVTLRGSSGPAAGQRIRLGDEPLVIGRDQEGEGNLSGDHELSRRHARVFLVSGRLAVEDLESTNGTFVNGRRIVYPTVIKPGDALEMGGTTLEVEDSPIEMPSRVQRAAVSAVHRAREAETGLLGRFADLTTRRPKQVLAAAGLFFVFSIAFGAPVVGLLSGHPEPDPDTESSITKEELERVSGARAGVGLTAIVRTDAPPRSAAARRKVQDVVATIKEEPEVAQVLDFYSTRNDSFVSKDGNSQQVGAIFKEGDQEAIDEVAEDISDELEKTDGVQVGGEQLTGPAVGETVGEDIGKAERLAFPLLFIVSIFVFRGVVAALLPILVGVITIFATFLALRVINATISEISVFALNMVIALGLGLAIDYSLFIVSRYREEVARLGHGPQAVQRAVQTAGRTIIFSALTVAAALASLLVFPQSFVRSMGFGGAVCSVIAVMVTLVVLPALLTVLGPRLDKGSTKRWRELTMREARGESKGYWYRLSRLVMRRPLAIAIASSALLILLGLPFFRIEFTGVDVKVLPDDNPVRQVDTILQEDFPSNQARRIVVVASAPASAATEVQEYARDLRPLQNVAAVEPPRQAGPELWQIDVVPRFSDLDDRTVKIVEDIRSRGSPFPVAVAGPTAEFIDQKDSLADHLPLGIGLLAIVTVIILFFLTGSLILPLKSLLMNLLTVSAALGLLVFVFQDGHLEGLLAFDSQGGIEITQPLLLFALAFGLSTDYAVFLLTRIKEARDGGAAEDEAVAIGLERTGRIVTSAAILFCIAIGAFATSEIIFIKQVGVGTAFAVIVDATIVRAFLVPSLMALLGRRNWWAPGPLRRLHDRYGVSEA